MNRNIEKSVQSLNAGGCCVYAAHVAKRLQHIVPTRVVVFNSEDIDINYVRANVTNNYSIREWYNNGMRFYHILVEFDYRGKTYLMDSTGIYDDLTHAGACAGDATYKTGELTIDETIAFASRPHGWNWWFDRRQIPTLKKHVNRTFRQLNKQLAVA